MNNKNLNEMARKERNKYSRNWRKNNKEKVKAINLRYWIKKAKEEEEKECNG